MDQLTATILPSSSYVIGVSTASVDLHENGHAPLDTVSIAVESSPARTIGVVPAKFLVSRTTSPPNLGSSLTVLLQCGGTAEVDDYTPVTSVTIRAGFTSAEVVVMPTVDAEDSSNVYLVKDGTLFLLYRRTDFEQMAKRSFSYANGIHGHYEIAMGVENYAAVDDTFKRVVSNGAVPVLEPTTEPWGQRTCYVADPEGNLIEIGSFTK